MSTGTALGGLFGHSPIAPIQHHMTLAEESVQLLVQVLQGCIDGDRDRVSAIYAQLDSNTTAAHAVRRETRQQLPRGLFLAMPRADLLTLLEMQGRLADAAQECARPLALRAMEIPAPLRKPLERLSTLIADCVSECLRAVRELDELITQGFGSHERRLIEKILDGLDTRTHRVTVQYEKVFTVLCREEGRLDTLDAFFFHLMADRLNRIAGTSGELGEQLRLLMAK